MAEQSQSSRVNLWMFVGFASFVFAITMLRPVYHSDIWGHLAYGRLICETWSLPPTEPFMPLAAGVAIVATAWLSQVIAFGVWSVAGVPGMQILHGMLLAFVAFQVQKSVFARTRSLFASSAGLAVLALVGYDQFSIIRPQLAGVACFAYLLNQLVSERLSCVRIGVLFIFWANLHPSFGAGLILLTIWLVAACIDVVRQSGLREVPQDRRIHNLFLLVASASVAVCVNPFGPSLFTEVLRVSANPNLRDLLDWQPLTLTSRQGQVAVAVGLGVVLLLLVRRRGPTTAEAFAFAAAGVATIASSRMINWWAPLAAIVAGLAVEPSTKTVLSDSRTRQLGGAGIVFALVITIAGLFIPEENRLSSVTPTEITPTVLEASHGKLIWAPNTWGDYLVWKSDGDVQIFATSHAHLIPRPIWQDYRRISTGSEDALTALRRHNVKFVLVGRRRRKLFERLLNSAEWGQLARTDRATLFSAHEERSQ